MNCFSEGCLHVASDGPVERTGSATIFIYNSVSQDTRGSANS